MSGHADHKRWSGLEIATTHVASEEEVFGWRHVSSDVSSEGDPKWEWARKGLDLSKVRPIRWTSMSPVWRKTIWQNTFLKYYNFNLLAIHCLEIYPIIFDKSLLLFYSFSYWLAFEEKCSMCVFFRKNCGLRAYNIYPLYCCKSYLEHFPRLCWILKRVEWTITFKRCIECSKTG